MRHSVKWFSTILLKDFPSSHKFNLAVVDLLHPFHSKSDHPRAFECSEKLRRKILDAGNENVVDQCYTTWLCAHNMLNCVNVLPLQLFSQVLFFILFKVIASIVEQLKFSFRRCNTHFSTAGAIKERENIKKANNIKAQVKSKEENSGNYQKSVWLKKFRGKFGAKEKSLKIFFFSVSSKISFSQFLKKKIIKKSGKKANLRIKSEWKEKKSICKKLVWRLFAFEK